MRLSVIQVYIKAWVYAKKKKTHTKYALMSNGYMLDDAPSFASKVHY